MINIRYCGSCGDFALIDKVRRKVMETTDLESEDIDSIECGSCDLEVEMEGNVVYSESREPFSVNKVVENIKNEMEV